MLWSILTFLLLLGICFAQFLSGMISEEKCNRLGGPGTFEKLKVENNETEACIQKIFNTTALPNEVREAERNGTLSTVLKKYIPKIPEFRGCMQNKLEVIKLCLTSQEREFIDTITSFADRISDYLQENGSERIIVFLDNGGIECIKYSMEHVAKCFEVHPLTFFDHNSDNCTNYDKVKDCIVEALTDNCPSKVLATITDDALKFAKSSICSEKKVIRSRRSLRRTVRQAIGGMGEKWPHIKKALRESCTDSKLEEHFNKSESCILEKPIFITPKDQYISHLDSCNKDVIKLLEKCLPEKLKYFPKLIFNVMDSTIRLLYDDFTEIGLGLGPCISKLKSQESKKDYHACVNRVEQENDDSIPESKEEFCSKFITLSECFVKQINDTCTPNDNLDKFTKDYRVAMKRPCS